MSKLIISGILTFSLILTPFANAEMLRSESFSGPNTLSWWDLTNKQWVDITNFVGADFDGSGFGDAKGHQNTINKDTSVYHSSPASIRLYTRNTRGETAEFWSNNFSPQKEIWMTWWERISLNYEFNYGHKFILFQSDAKGNDPYINWQGSSGNGDNYFNYRVYASDPYACNGGIFARGNITLPTEQWYQWKVHIKFNTIGLANGHWQTWVDLQDGNGWTVVDSDVDIEIICKSYYGIICTRFGGTREYADGTPSIGQRWIDDIKIGTTEADVDGDNDPPDNDPPDPPKGLILLP